MIILIKMYDEKFVSFSGTIHNIGSIATPFVRIQTHLFISFNFSISFIEISVLPCENNEKTHISVTASLLGTSAVMTSRYVR